jgi:hypothetical protein
MNLSHYLCKMIAHVCATVVKFRTCFMMSETCTYCLFSCNFACHTRVYEARAACVRVSSPATLPQSLNFAVLFCVDISIHFTTTYSFCSDGFKSFIILLVSFISIKKTQIAQIKRVCHIAFQKHVCTCSFGFQASFSCRLASAQCLQPVGAMLNFTLTLTLTLILFLQLLIYLYMSGCRLHASGKGLLCA